MMTVVIAQRDAQKTNCRPEHVNYDMFLYSPQLIHSVLIYAAFSARV